VLLQILFFFFARTTISFIFLIIRLQFRSIVSRTVIGKLFKSVSLLKKSKIQHFEYNPDRSKSYTII
jgi:hypothetical protein